MFHLYRPFVFSFLLVSAAVGQAEEAKNLKVGVYNGDASHDSTKKFSYGHEGILRYLQEHEDLSATEFSSLAPAELVRFDAVILPSMDIGGFDSTPAGEKALPHYNHSLAAYAESGGGVILLSKAAGFNYPWPVRTSPFPDIASGYFQLSFIPWRKPEWPLQPSGDHELAESIEAFLLPKTQDFGDGSVVLREGKKGSTFMTVCQGYPMGVSGQAGRGRAVFIGLALGAHKEQGDDGKWHWKEGIKLDAEKLLLRKAIDWVAQARPTQQKDIAKAVAAAADAKLASQKAKDMKAQKEIEALKSKWSVPFDPSKSGPRKLPGFIRGFSVQYHPQDPASQQRLVRVLKESHSNLFLHHYGWEKTGLLHMRRIFSSSQPGKASAE